MRKARMCPACGKAVTTVKGRFILHGKRGICAGSGVISADAERPKVGIAVRFFRWMKRSLTVRRLVGRSMDHELKRITHDGRKP